jgi:hypothetical protein
MSSKSKHDWADILARLKILANEGPIDITLKSLAEHFGLARSTFADGMRTLGINTMDQLKEILGMKTGSANFERDGDRQAEYGDSFINIICASRRMLTKEDIIKEFKINIDEWKLDKYRVRTSEGYRKDRKVEWHVKDQAVIQGDVSDSGKMLVVPLYHLELRFIRNTEAIRTRLLFDDLKEESKSYVPVYPKIHYKKNREGFLFEIGMPDLHFGRLTWGEETGNDYDVKIASAMVEDVLTDLLSHARGKSIGRILLPLGNDFFNVNSKGNITVGGTPQQEDTRWQKTYRLGRLLAIKIIDMCSTIAPVDVLMIPGNHDEEKLFYMGDALDCWYNNNQNVSINNVARTRKYYPFGKCLLGFTHGADIKIDKLIAIMPHEEPELWSKSLFREWHIGHVHHSRSLQINVDEQIGIVIRTLRSLVPEDAWTFNSGYVGSVRAAEGFMWDPNKGLIAQYTAPPTLGV